MDDGRWPDEKDEVVSDAGVRLEVERKLTQRNCLAFLRVPNSVKATHNTLLQSLSIHHDYDLCCTIHACIDKGVARKQYTGGSSIGHGP